MLIDKILDDLDLPDPDDRRGSPFRGSRLGACVRQSAYALYPGVYPPDPLPARSKLVFRFGNMIHELVRREFRRLVPGQWGMEESRFHFRVPLTEPDAKRALAMAQDPGTAGVVRMKVMHGFNPEDLMRSGLVLNTAEPALYIPTHLDGIVGLEAFDPRYSLASCEIKSMASRGFLRALNGDLDYGYRVQMAIGADAAGLDTQMYVAVNKNTCHLLEVVYTKRVDRVEVRFTKASRMVEILRDKLPAPMCACGHPLAPHPGGGACIVCDCDGFNSKLEWEAAEVSHPFELGLVEQARERVRILLHATPEALPPREYGPDFDCRKCGTAGKITCKTCKGTGVTKVKKQPCGPCGGAKLVECPKCEGKGRHARAPLPWQCSYCPHVRECWKDLYTLEVTDKPVYMIEREAFEIARVAVVPPEPKPLPVPEPVLDEEAEESPLPGAGREA